ncbi:unnamed protein product [Arabis nemorensis]|uniref:Protein kinase domain-containing protein n=1 Tax=Arabis nemorensis TaxID=586526 RepID=A0A565AW19_9BRAS|nr:unnamed protein product [Arabis nemorensis]
MLTKIELVKFLDEGNNGSVDLVKYIKSHGSSPIYAAVKTSKCKNNDYLQREIEILSLFKGCKRIVQCYGNYELVEDLDRDGSRSYKMVMEYAAAGNLTTFMDNYKDRKLPETMIKDFTRMILQGLVSIHSHGYVHCDLKPDNLLVFPCKQSYELKISDFGSSEVVGDIPFRWKISSPYVGTPIYMSPESVKNGVAEKALDLWSLGCIVLEMYTGEEPWPEVSSDDFASFLLSGKTPQIPESVPCDAREFLETCFARDPKDRGNASKLLSHRFLSDEDMYGPWRLFAPGEVEEQTSSNMQTKPEFVKFLDKGSNGSVHLVKYIKSDRLPPLFAAVKTVQFEDYDILQREIDILSLFKGCNRIVQCYGNYEVEEDIDRNGSRIYKMVMEYAGCGSLATFMDNYNDRKLPETMIIDFTRMILQGLVSIHDSNGYVHCDIKPANILVFPCGQSYELKIADFGSSTIVGDIATTWEEFDGPYAGTAVYMSPESVKNGVAEKALDLWSLGCVVLEMFTGESPWSEVDDDDLDDVLLGGKAIEIPESVPCYAREFLKKCFSRIPEDRGSASKLLSHRFLSEEDIYGLRRLFSAVENEAKTEVEDKTRRYEEIYKAIAEVEEYYLSLLC